MKIIKDEDFRLVEDSLLVEAMLRYAGLKVSDSLHIASANQAKTSYTTSEDIRRLLAVQKERRPIAGKTQCWNVSYCNSPSSTVFRYGRELSRRSGFPR